MCAECHSRIMRHFLKIQVDLIKYSIKSKNAHTYHKFTCEFISAVCLQMMSLPKCQIGHWKAMNQSANNQI